AQDGISIDFNSDIAAYRISLYDSGYTYQRYTEPLPFNIKWGMSLLEIEELTGVHDAVKGNEYATTLISEGYQMECYFTNKLLSHMRLTASVKALQKHTEKLKAANQMRLLPNGVIKEGNVIDGTGTMIWGNGTAVYKGEWSYGLPHGRGEYLDTFGNRYAGDFKLGFFWGQGNFYSKAYGYSYSGTYAMSSKHGEGRIQYTDDTKYQGYWVQDNMHGGGVYSMGTRYIYKGEIVQNKLTGQGIVETPDGTISGIFKDGKPNGMCTQTSKDNIQSITGPFKNGKKNGKFTALVLGEERIIYYENDIEVLPKN
ncbi:MAG: hypothetical protein QMC70_05920, partial [Bacteroidia bacterium]